MKRVHLAALGRLLAVAGLLVPSGVWAQENNHRNDSGNLNQQDSQRNRDNRQKGADEEETEYRGMEHAALGVMLSEREGQGVRIRDILPDSPAAKAGLRAGDRITKLDDKPMATYREVIRFINRVEPGQTANLTIDRDGQEKTLRVTFASRDQIYGQQPYQAGYRGLPSGEQQVVLGVNLDNQKGAVMVTEIWPGSPAEQAGLRKGDEIVSVDGHKAQDWNDVISTVQNHKAGDNIAIVISREGSQQTLQARLESQEEWSAASRERDRTQNREGDRSRSREGDQTQPRASERDQPSPKNADRGQSRNPEQKPSNAPNPKETEPMTPDR